MSEFNHNDTIAALATGRGGAIALVRVSGPEAIALCDSIFSGRGSLAAAQGYTLHYGSIMEGDRVVDEVVVGLFRAPRSYTGQDMVEISCHGSGYVVGEIMRLLLRAGARSAGPGEFTVRAFLAGKIDLAQAEAVADLIASESRAAHAMAANQMRGSYSADFARLRGRLVELASLLELELDFGEEDVTFADRGALRSAVVEIEGRIGELLGSFSVGNAIKEGVAVAIVGDANVGKSTLLNRLLHDDRAMVSDIAGTTRDAIEERLVIDGVMFRLIDTAGIRPTEDVLELMGIERSLSSARKAQIVLLVVDGTAVGGDAFEVNACRRIDLNSAVASLGLREEQKLCIVLNKSDIAYADVAAVERAAGCRAISISARRGDGIDELTAWLSEAAGAGAVYGGRTVLSNARHVEALERAHEALAGVRRGLASDLSVDLLAQELREAIYHIGAVTGEITTDDILSEIFSKFCIGK
ncbi:MAG: tRNA uridine-5-carboxymethylaminomethyl(34) synthesis GTPase MnmE [Rikenellaceae bacterium]|jgi:tRNA modification GTPase|nr:tRNA uridine-5-carboxymethylaminomethyl(34) synthesis GTPase MnmE [Rikenellaceae bacterium]